MPYGNGWNDIGELRNKAMILHQEDPPLTTQIVAPIPLFAIRLPPVFHDLMASALGTLYCHSSHSPLLGQVIDNKGISIPIN